MNSEYIEAWIDACIDELKERWRTADPILLAGIAADLAHDRKMSKLTPAEAAAEWLRPLLLGRQG